MGRFQLSRPNPMLHFAPFLSTPSESYALNLVFFFHLILSNFKFSAVLSIFREGVRIEPHTLVASGVSSGGAKTPPPSTPPYTFTFNSLPLTWTLGLPGVSRGLPRDSGGVSRGSRPLTVGVGGVKCAHFRVPAFKNTTKIQRKDPKKREERKKNCGGRENKSKLWASPPFWVHPSGFHPSGLHPSGPKPLSHPKH